MNYTHHNISPPLNQQGIGLVEVLVSLLLLAVAALGYSALQARSLQTTDESLNRTQAIVLLRSTAEKIRTNISSLDATTTTPTTPTTILESYKKNLQEELSKISDVTCTNDICTPSQLVIKDSREIKKSAQNLGIKIGATTCPGTTKTGAGQTLCLIAAWNDTNPTKGSSQNDCINNEGVYNFNSDCVYMETY